MTALSPSVYCCNRKYPSRRVATNDEGHRFLTGYCAECRNVVVQPFQPIRVVPLGGADMPSLGVSSLTKPGASASGSFRAV